MPRRSKSDAADGGVDFSAIEPVSVPRLSDTISDRIRDLIVSQDLQPGTRLPSERTLAEQFGTSRPTVSQAMRTLSLMGLIEARRGSGAYVLRRPQEAGLIQLLSATPENLDDLLELRLWLESLGVREAIPHVTKKDVRQARAALDRLVDSVGETSSWIAADTVFHASVVGLARNPLLTALYEQVHTALLEYEYHDWVEEDRVPDWLASSEASGHLALHEPIVDALEQRDVEAALAAVERHNEVMGEHLRGRQAPRPRGGRAARRQPVR